MFFFWQVLTSKSLSWSALFVVTSYIIGGSRCLMVISPWQWNCWCESAKIPPGFHAGFPHVSYFNLQFVLFHWLSPTAKSANASTRGLKKGQAKMSKSDPDSAIFMEDAVEDLTCSGYWPCGDTQNMGFFLCLGIYDKDIKDKLDMFRWCTQ